MAKPKVIFAQIKLDTGLTIGYDNADGMTITELMELFGLTSGTAQDAGSRLSGILGMILERFGIPKDIFNFIKL